MRLAPLIGYLILLMGVIFTIYETTKVANEAKQATVEIRKADKRAKKQSAVARDQVCRVFEGQHLREVQQLSKTYTYLDEVVKRGETASLLNQFVIRGLQRLETDARTDPAPEFCDKPHVGLPEPDPVLPKRRDFSRYLVK